MTASPLRLRELLERLVEARAGDRPRDRDDLEALEAAQEVGGEGD